jgi:imidazolonepropionase-like amidohydrolase
MGRARLALVWFALAITAVAGAPAQTPDGTAAFRLYRLGQPVGRESDTYTLFSDGRKIDSTFSWDAQGTTLSLTATIETTQDWSPRRLVVRGQPAPGVQTDTEVTIAGGRAHVRDGQRTADVDVAGKLFFPVDTYAPIAVQEQLIRYWRGRGRPKEILSAPGGTIHIVHRADEQVQIEGRSTVLERVSVEGPVWGRETAWVEGGGAIAAMTTWAAGVPFQAVRDGYETRFPVFLEQATADRIEDLNRMPIDNQPDESGSFALVGATVIDGTKKPPITDAVVIVKGDRLDAVGPASKVHPAPEVPTVDVHGMTIVAGFWDMQARVSHIEVGPAFLASGITTVRDIGGDATLLDAVRDAMSNDEGFGPRIVLAGLVEGAGPDSPNVVRAASPDDGRQAVRRYRSSGYRQVVLSADVAAPVVRAAALEGRRYAFPVAATPAAGQTTEQILDLGLDELILRPMSNEGDAAALKSLAPGFSKRRLAIDPLLAFDELTVGVPAAAAAEYRTAIARLPTAVARTFADIPPTLDAGKAASRTAALESVRDAVKAGAKVVAGARQGVPGFSLQRELELLVEGGLTPLEALQAATVTPAQLMGFGDSGTVENGKRADLVILAGDPLANISNVRTAKWVVAAGKLYECSRLWKLAGFAGQ